MSNAVAACPKCNGDMEQRPGMFYWRGNFKPGWVCAACNGLWAVAGKEIAPLKGTGMAAASKSG